MPLSPNELLIIGVIVLLVFGGAWLPRLARNAGRAKAASEPVREQVAAVAATHGRYQAHVRSIGRKVAAVRRFTP